MSQNIELNICWMWESNSEYWWELEEILKKVVRIIFSSLFYYPWWSRLWTGLLVSDPCLFLVKCFTVFWSSLLILDWFPATIQIAIQKSIWFVVQISELVLWCQPANQWTGLTVSTCKSVNCFYDVNLQISELVLRCQPAK